jgi:flagellar FliJ protein
VSGQWLLGYHGFLAQLDTAIDQQRQSLAWHQKNLDNARDAWQQAFAKVEGLRKLVQRYREEAQRLEDKREQKLLDELSQRLPRQNPF